jgi:type I restriction enzyme M protein
MRHFATESGKAKGQFYTPAEVSRVLAAVVGVTKASSAQQSIYDPTCGSGSLLLKAHSQALAATGLDLAIYGQEMDNATSALAKMNMILHGVPTAEVWQDNTLSSPHFKDGAGLKKFDFVVANPPFSNKSWTTGLDPENDLYGRFVYGVPPAKNGDYAFLLHMLASLKPEGKAAVILPHGVLFRGNAEGTIRKALVERGFIKAVIGLPPNLFYGTGIPACVVVLNKEGAAKRTSILMIDASRGFAKDGNKNRLRERDIHRIVDAFNTGADVPGFARNVPITEIADSRNDYNLNLPRYLSSAVGADRQDLAAHLAGGIPNTDLDDLSTYWDVAPGLRGALFQPSGNAGYSTLRVPLDRVAELVAANEDLEGFAEDTRKNYTSWCKAHRTALVDIDSSVKSSDLIQDLSESLLGTFKASALLDEYALYQDLMQYWAESMRDDVEAVRTDGWLGAAEPTQVTDAADKGTVDYTVDKAKYRSLLVGRELIVNRFCSKQSDALEEVEAELSAAQVKMSEMLEEQDCEGGLLDGVTNEKGQVTGKSLLAFALTVPPDPSFLDEIDLLRTVQSLQASGDKAAVNELLKTHRGSLLKNALTPRGTLTKASVSGRLESIPRDPAFTDELHALEQLQDDFDRVSELKTRRKELSQQLESAIEQAYKGLDESTVLELVVDDKWLAIVGGHVEAELTRVRSQLVDRITTLDARYRAPLPELEQRSEELSAAVDKHLREMGLSW